MKYIYSLCLALLATANVMAEESKIYASLDSLCAYDCPCFMQEKTCDDCACGSDCDCNKK